MGDSALSAQHLYEQAVCWGQDVFVCDTVDWVNDCEHEHTVDFFFYGGVRKVSFCSRSAAD
jgi:hypothetical protein